MPPLSAFAARQARQAPRTPNAADIKDQSVAAIPTESQLQNIPVLLASPAQDSTRPAKRERQPSQLEKRVRIKHNATENLQQISFSDTGSSSDAESSSEANEDEPVEVAARQLCNVTEPSVLVDRGRRGHTISLGVNETLAFVGIYILRVDKGVVRVLGATVKASSKAYQVFAPSTHCLPVIEHVQNPFGASQPAEITLSASEPEIQGLGRLNPSFDSIWNGNDPSGRSFTFVSKSTDDPNGRTLDAFSAPSSWQALLPKLSEPSKLRQRVIMICGPKGSGKSTFARTLTNALLSVPAVGESGTGLSFMDLDPGQPEFSAPGDISLSTISEFILGPPYTHPWLGPGFRNQLVRAHHLGTTTPKDDTAHYLDAARDLAATHRQQPARPLVVNTCGWIQGTGLDVLEELVQALGATEVVWTSAAGPAEAVAALAEQAQRHGAALHLLDSAPPSAAAAAGARSAADLRAMQTASYFHQAAPVAGTPYWDARALDMAGPQSVVYAGDDPDVLGVVQLGPAIDPAQLARVLEGTAVSLVAVEDTACLGSTVGSSSGSAATTSAVPYIFRGHGACDPLPARSTRALGQLFVAAIDKEAGSIHVHTPLDLPSIFADSRATGTALVLVRGAHLDAPRWAYAESLHDAAGADGAPDVASWADRQRWVDVLSGRRGTRADDQVSAARQTGASMWRTRRNLLVRDGSRRTTRD